MAIGGFLGKVLDPAGLVPKAESALGKGDKGPAPAIPDYVGLAEKTAQSNADAAQKALVANRPNQTDVYGNTSSWAQDPTTGQWQQSQNLGALGQQRLGLQEQLMGQASSTLGQPLTADGLPSADIDAVRAKSGLFNMDPTGNSQAIQDATYKLLTPEREQSRASEVQRLKNQGLTEDSPAFQRAMTRLDQGDTDAQLKSLIAGQQEYGNAFQRGLSENNQNYNQTSSTEQLAQALRSQGLGERQGLRDANSGLSELSQISNVGGPQFGNFVSATNPGGTDYLGAGDATYKAQSGQANADAQAKSNQTSGLIGLAGTAASIFL